MEKTVGWGILGTGKIARSFAEGLAFVPGAQLVAVGSRSMTTAGEFASRYHVRRAHGSYAALANDEDVEVVYVATPHALHYENCVLCLEAGKAVLCEKPFTINAAQAEQVIRLARARNLFLMEAMWTRYIPLVVHLRALLARGAIGDVQLFAAGLGMTPYHLPPTHYMLKRELGGGILLDAGIYPVSLASMVFRQQPARITGLAEFEGGVDVQDAFIFAYENGGLASIHLSLKTEIPPEFSIAGRTGRIIVHPPLFRPTALTLTRFGYDEERLEMPLQGNGWNYQAVEVAACLRAGRLESDVMPLAETLAIMQTLDRIRAQWNFKYPFE
jgi:dihydrodiol dehydrogenase / D-xylose 1-dehydrogenase (NADP)